MTQPRQTTHVDNISIPVSALLPPCTKLRHVPEWASTHDDRAWNSGNQVPGQSQQRGVGAEAEGGHERDSVTTGSELAVDDAIS